MRVSIVIPTYHDWGRLRLCLESLARQSLSDSEFEVIVVNNDPEDPCPYELPAPNMVLLEEGNPGSYAARNLGIAKASGKIIGFTDSDCIPDRDWIRNALSHFDTQPDVDCIAGEVVLFSEEGTKELIFLYQKEWTMNQRRNVLKNQYGITANLFVRKETFENFGAFREDLFSGGDLEWGKRTSKEGVRLIYRSDVLVKHPSRKTLAAIIRKKRRTTGGYFQLVFSRLKYRQKVKKFIRDIIPPVHHLKSVDQTVSIQNKIGLLFIAWINQLTGLQELVRLGLLKGRRRRE